MPLFLIGSYSMATVSLKMQLSGGPVITPTLQVGLEMLALPFSLDQAQGTLLVHVLQGPLNYLVVNLPTEANQGTTIEFDILGYDVSGNPVPIHQCSAVITTDAGDANCDTDGWKLDIKESGELIVHARVQSTVGTPAEGSDFISVESTWFGWGNNTQVIIAFSLLIVLLISAILVAVFKHLDMRISEEIEEDSETDSGEPATTQSTLPTLPAPTIAQSPPPPLPVNVPQVQPTVTTTHPMPSPIVPQLPSPTIQTQHTPAVTTTNPVMLEHIPMASQPSPVVSQPSEPNLSPPSRMMSGVRCRMVEDGSSTLVDQAETYTQQAT